MLQPPRVAKGLKVAVTVLSVLAVLLLSAVGYVLLKLEPERKAANAPVVTLAELRDTDDAPVRELPQNVQEKQEQPAQEPAAGEPEADVQEDAALMPEAPESEAQTVDSEVKAIRAEYNAIEEKRTAGQYEKTLLRQSAYSYTDDGEPACIILRSGADGLDFERSYYFNGGMLRFALFEAEDACRLYFKDDVLLRLRYAEDARKASEYVDYDGSGGEEYDAWRDFALSEAYALYADACTVAAERSEYILPDSDSRYLSEDDLRGLSADECRLARNEIFARHGRCFDDAELQAYFDACSWYTGTIAASAFNENVFNAYEEANVALIREYERKMGYR